MKAINPKALKQLRKKRGLSHDKLADKTTIGRRRLIELEKETAELHKIQDGNFADLCRALNATPAQLCGEEPIIDPMPAHYVTLRSKITTVSQMNYDLISAQYGVESDQIVQLAPLMFAILVEDSFNWRRDQLEMRKQILDLQEKLQETVYAEHVMGPDALTPLDVLRHEEEAIDQRDVFTVPLEATNALLRYEEVIGNTFFDNIEDLKKHRRTDRFTDFMAEKIRSNREYFTCDMPHIDTSPMGSDRSILDPELRYITVPDLYERLTESDDDQTTAILRLALLTGAVRLSDADAESGTKSTEMKAWLVEQLKSPDMLSKLAEIAPSVSFREIRGPDEEGLMSLDDFGFPVILESPPETQQKRCFATGLAGKSNPNDDEGDENASA